MDTGSRLLAEVEGGGPPPSSPPPRRPHLGGPWPGLRLTVVAALVLLVAGGISAVVFTSTGGGEALTGRTDARAPAFSLPELTDTARSVSLSQLGGHDVVLNFWASWCYPCTTEMPVLQAAHRSDPSVRFVGI
ncbi:MAG TPA: TlpA disulfide reductase family protein, partial [Acidimicrobiales bacterium]|nr:TlpA disulfide reductase family protein [Acidimicrobiales bacterium]